MGTFVIAIGVVFVSLLTAALAARFIRTDNTEMIDMRDALARIEADVAEIKAGLRG